MTNQISQPRYKKSKNWLNYNSVYLNLARVRELVCIQQGRKGLYDALLRCSQISASQTAVKRQNVKPPGVTLFIAVHNCTILQNAVPIIGALRHILNNCYCAFILCVSFAPVTQNLNSREIAVGRFGARILKRTRDSFLSTNSTKTLGNTHPPTERTRVLGDGEAGGA